MTDFRDPIFPSRKPSKNKAFRDGLYGNDANSQEDSHDSHRFTKTPPTGGDSFYVVGQSPHQDQADAWSKKFPTTEPPSADDGKDGGPHPRTP